jgi:hypothetical protein
MAGRISEHRCSPQEPHQAASLQCLYSGHPGPLSRRYRCVRHETAPRLPVCKFHNELVWTNRRMPATRGGLVHGQAPGTTHSTAWGNNWLLEPVWDVQLTVSWQLRSHGGAGHAASGTAMTAGSSWRMMPWRNLMAGGPAPRTKATSSVQAVILTQWMPERRVFKDSAGWACPRRGPGDFRRPLMGARCLRARWTSRRQGGIEESGLCSPAVKTPH